MSLKRQHLAILLPFGGAVLGAVAGTSLVLLNPPQHSDDHIFGLIVAGGGLSVLGLLCGFLCSLWSRGRIGILEVVAVIGILIGIFGWFINGKGGRWEIANVFAILFWVAVVTFAIRAIALISKQKRRATPRIMP